MFDKSRPPRLFQIDRMYIRVKKHTDIEGAYDCRVNNFVKRHASAVRPSQTDEPQCPLLTQSGHLAFPHGLWNSADSWRWTLFYWLAPRPPCRLGRSDGGEHPKTDAERGLAAVVCTPHRGEAIDFKFEDPES
jgi:hypothetical protein